MKQPMRSPSKVSQTGVEESRSSRRSGRTHVEAGELAQLATMMNSSHSVQTLVQLREEIADSREEPHSPAQRSGSPSVTQLYRKVDKFTAQPEGATPLFATENVEPELTYDRSWTELWINKNYRAHYPTATSDPASVGLLASDDSSLAIHDTTKHPKEFYAIPSVLAASNATLARLGSTVRLAKGGGAVTVAGQRLQKVKPENVRQPAQDDSADFVDLLQHECFRVAGEVIGMRGNVQSEIALGRKGAKRSIGINPGPESDAQIEALTRTLARSGKTINPHSVVKELPKEKGLPEEDAKTYGVRSGKGQLDKTASTLGLNQFAEPEVGEAYAIFSNAADAARKRDFSKLLSGGKPTERTDVWGYHFAGVVAKSVDGKDRIALENYNRAANLEKLTDNIRDAVLEKYRKQLGQLYTDLQGADHMTLMATLDSSQLRIAGTALKEYRRIRSSSAPSRRWFFQIYGTSAGQTFHEKQAASGGFVNPLTVRVQKPLADMKQDTVAEVERWAESVTTFEEKYKDESKTVLAGVDVAGAIDEFKARVQSAGSQEALHSQKLRVKESAIDGMIERAQELRQRTLESYLGADKSFFENLTDFSMRLDSATLLGDIDSLGAALAGLRNFC